MCLPLIFGEIPGAHLCSFLCSVVLCVYVFVSSSCVLYAHCCRIVYVNKKRGCVLDIIWQWKLSLPMPSLPITTRFISTTLARGKAYSIQPSLIVFVCNIRGCQCFANTLGSSKDIWCCQWRDIHNLNRDLLVGFLFVWFLIDIVWLVLSSVCVVRSFQLLSCLSRHKDHKAILKFICSKCNIFVIS